MCELALGLLLLSFIVPIIVLEKIHPLLLPILADIIVVIASFLCVGIVLSSLGII